MKELFEIQASIFEKHNILISYFSTDSGKIRIYFKDLNNNYLHNPITYEVNSNKKTNGYYLLHNNLEEALKHIIQEINIYKPIS